MTSLKSFQLNLSIVFGLFLIAASASAADWPTYRHDNARTGSTSESLTTPLMLQWIYTPAHPPRSAVRRPQVDCKAVVRQFRGIAVSDNLEIELVAQDKKLSSKKGVPVLCGVEVLRERKAAEVATMVHTRQ